MKPPEIDWDKIHEIIEKHKGDRWGLIPLLQEVQEHTGYIPPEAIEPIAEAMNLFPSEVQGVITFYRSEGLPRHGLPRQRQPQRAPFDAKRAGSQRRRDQPGLSIYTGNGCLSGGLFSGAHHDDQPGLFRQTFPDQGHQRPGGISKKMKLSACRRRI
jgi:hypothetical protein